MDQSLWINMFELYNDIKNVHVIHRKINNIFTLNRLLKYHMIFLNKCRDLIVGQNIFLKFVFFYNMLIGKIIKDTLGIVDSKKLPIEALEICKIAHNELQLTLEYPSPLVLE